MAKKAMKSKKRSEASASDAPDVCAFCKTEAPPLFDSSTGQPLPRRHPMAAVMQTADVPEGATPIYEAESDRGREFVSVPCCRACHEEPGRRPGAKAHFFPRATARAATVMAGTDGNIGG